MAVTPNLTFPSKRLLAEQSFSGDPISYRIIATARRSGMQVLVGVTPRFLKPMLWYTPIQHLLVQHDVSLRVRMVVRRRGVTVNIASPAKKAFSGFPVPYLPRVTTRPPYGEQWPRFAQYGSTM